MRGIPTMYAGAQFRSRIEARWASMFDRLGWRWEYEPFDANGYIPDFVLMGDEPVLVEVKAHMTLAELEPVADDVAKKIDGVWEHDFLVLGGAPWFRASYINGDIAIGLLGEFTDVGQDWATAHGEPRFTWHIDEAIWCDIEWPQRGERLDFCHAFGSYRNRISGHYDGNQHPTNGTALLDSLWRGAGNEVQWRKPA